MDLFGVPRAILEVTLSALLDFVQSHEDEVEI